MLPQPQDKRPAPNGASRYSLRDKIVFHATALRAVPSVDAATQAPITPTATTPSPTTAPITLTLMPKYTGTVLKQVTLTLGELACLIEQTTAPSKGDLPLLKLATFGTKRSDNGSLRTGENMLAITGIEVEHDGEKLGFRDAYDIMGKAGIQGIVYTSPSHRICCIGGKGHAARRLRPAQAVMPKICCTKDRCAGMSPRGTARTCPLASIAIASMPASVRFAVQKP
jgi:hypothetical protein